ncbi:hypothetical protein EYF80_013417 [Liparis tanakae]|uniref:Uncharacterized protein n=1 Tax=Liparis tanakae TaxID=230148 RepID=A0A4Z2IE98_9TELE|nr:hypothetical protein EYF80_013417 [Liparis tanakae]
MKRRSSTASGHIKRRRRDTRSKALLNTTSPVSELPYQGRMSDKQLQEHYLTYLANVESRRGGEKVGENLIMSQSPGGYIGKWTGCAHMPGAEQQQENTGLCCLSRSPLDTFGTPCPSGRGSIEALLLYRGACERTADSSVASNVTRYCNKASSLNSRLQSVLTLPPSSSPCQSACSGLKEPFSPLKSNYRTEITRNF